MPTWMRNLIQPSASAKGHVDFLFPIRLSNRYTPQSGAVNPKDHNCKVCWFRGSQRLVKCLGSGPWWSQPWGGQPLRRRQPCTTSSPPAQAHNWSWPPLREVTWAKSPALSGARARTVMGSASWRGGAPWMTIPCRTAVRSRSRRGATEVSSHAFLCWCAIIQPWGNVEFKVLKSTGAEWRPF